VAPTHVLARWGGPALAAIGAAVYLWYALRPLPALGIVGFAVVTGVHAFDLSLPLVGAGLILARLDVKPAMVSYALFVVALTSSVMAGGPFAQWLTTTPGAVERFVLVGPAGSVLVGVALLLPDAFRRWLAPLATILTGAAFGIAIRLFDPTVGDRRYALTLALVALWLVTVPFLIGHRHRRQWFAIATRIVGSWLIAIGILLAALLVLPRNNPGEPPSPALHLPQAKPALAALFDGGTRVLSTAPRRRNSLPPSPIPEVLK